jgi:hypothetical protein
MDIFVAIWWQRMRIEAEFYALNSLPEGKEKP